MSLCVFAVVAYTMFVLWLYREVQVMESQGGSGATEGGGGDGQSGQAASTALIEKILSEEPRWQGKSVARHTQRFHKQGKLPFTTPSCYLHSTKQHWYTAAPVYHSSAITATGKSEVERKCPLTPPL